MLWLRECNRRTTGISLANQVIKNIERKTKWINVKDLPCFKNLEGLPKAEKENELEIISKRKGEAPGTHTVKYLSAIDDIEIMHKAHNRKGFALGAVLAAEFVKGKKGVYGMNDLLKL